ncbi:DEAD/DEAH box helicase [Helicobacter saguini]|uniref:Transcription-repair-coupling factor n=1 Tax=Helicobacter saguini TaxID=1548018 RepID=A0A347VTU7_9HELI|nr:DEAD/DEAH box helicase [Helicobacter saguini]MWV67787.1 DEAD/DEAH box helicase [Helicobacter saguini]MWV70745.1 DEAD/DEAH box helicase [Helicobacter saguini]MWV72649.1 DEAD/DEAH box helicase [Helicobacter saguini]TLD94612.1 DEAD/DEAH box helicase [Helicobacter saguini]
MSNFSPSKVTSLESNNLNTNKVIESKSIFSLPKKDSKDFKPKIIICSSEEIELAYNALSFILDSKKVIESVTNNDKNSTQTPKNLTPTHRPTFDKNKKQKVLKLPDIRLSPFSNTQTFYEEFKELFATLTQWYERDESQILITTPHTISNFLPPKELLSTFTLHLNQNITPDSIAQKLMNYGYERVEIVEMQGEFSLRGDILDIFIPSESPTFESQNTQESEQNPVRISFFDTEIESIRYFDLQTQLSQKEELKSIKISPALFSLDSKNSEFIESKLDEMVQNEQILKPEASIANFAFWFLESLNGVNFLAKYPHIFTPLALKEYKENLEFINQNLIPQNSQKVSIFNTNVESKDMDLITFNHLSNTFSLNENKQIYLLSPSVTLFKSSLEALNFEPKAITNIESRFQDSKLFSYKITESNTYKNLNLYLTPYYFNINTKEKMFISLEKPLKTQKRRVKLDIDSLKVGEFICHSEYGIGVFECIKQVDIMGATQDFLSIIYANDDRLLLPVANLNLIEKYSAYDTAIKLDRLGKGSFAKLKDSIKEKLLAIANEIVRVQALRDLSKGVYIEIETPSKLLAYKNFESRRGFELTKDQEAAINAGLSDFKSGRVMDRILNGDVGFGKSEVAMSLAYAAALNGYVTIVLVPTTLLCNQHFDTFSERFEGLEIPDSLRGGRAGIDIESNLDSTSQTPTHHPIKESTQNKKIKVAKIDRFTTAKEKQNLQDSIKKGETQIIIGTHALFNLEITNLGLIVIDEEHKFGVKQKEIFKEKGLNTHLLSMSATPIPRTLNMAYSKIKSISEIKTPPFFKQDSKTFVKLKSDTLLKEIITRELRRGGQVFYIFNNIAKINTIKTHLESLLPNLKILVLHSKIPPKDTEQGMIDFLHKKYDVLLCTSIVESGIHLPNANSIIIDNAHNFGIADLHQLRGRVGRGKNVGYCYLLASENINEDSTKRLLSLEKNSYLGSGAALAYHDLEIRGGGNLLGSAQSGHIKQVGFGMYVRLLEETLQSLTQSGVSENKVDIKLSVSAFLNDNLINSERLRLELYRRLSLAKSESEVREIEREIEERFGRLDTYSLQFLEIIIIKILAMSVGVKAISNAGANIAITMNDNSRKYLTADTKDEDDILICVKKFLKGEIGKR